MKKLLWMAALAIGLGGSAMAQDNEVPQAAKDHFASTYPTATEVKWDKEGDGFEVKFKVNGIEWEGEYDMQGAWKGAERDLKKEEVPQVVWDGLKASEYGSWEADDPEENQKPDHRLLYSFEVKKDGMKKVVYFTPEGLLVPALTEDEKDDQ